jgi:ribosomal protein S18 acetylase RimI-like enzyme
VRRGSEADEGALLELFDEAVAWLVARGQVGQWGSKPFSERPEMVERVHGMATSGGLWVEELDGAAVGAVVLGASPAHVPAATRPEVYIDLLLSSRRCAGMGIGRRLVDHAVRLACESEVEQLRVDCWAGADRLVRWYEEMGFTRSGTFDVTGWRGQLFVMELLHPCSSGSGSIG